MRHATDVQLVDAHVHFHPCFELPEFLAAAAANFRIGAEESGRAGRAAGVLMLTDVEGQDVFAEWSELARQGRSRGGWRFHATDESCSLVAVRDPEAFLIHVVAGRQIRTREGLEILAHGVTKVIPDGLPFRTALERASRLAPIVSIPWGFGKWWFRRGRVIAKVAADLPDGAFLADNGCRPAWMTGPGAVQARHGIGSRPVLAGSDPLPFADHQGRAGSFGFAVPGPVDEQRPLERLARRVRDGDPVEPYGSRRGIPGVIADQIRLRIPDPTDRSDNPAR